MEELHPADRFFIWCSRCVAAGLLCVWTAATIGFGYWLAPPQCPPAEVTVTQQYLDGYKAGRQDEFMSWQNMTYYVRDRDMVPRASQIAAEKGN